MAARPLPWLVAELGKAIRDAQAAVDEHAVARFHDLVHRPTAAGPQPRHLPVPLPQAGGGYAVRDVPVAALVHHNHLTLEEVRVSLRVALLHDEASDGLAVRLEPLHPGGAPGAGEGGPLADDGGPASVGTFSLTFRHQAAPEGQARVATLLHQKI